MARDRDAGVILMNVLVVLALAATIVHVMLTLADLAITRSQGFRDAGEGLALVRGAEQFAIAALRRDMIEAPETDNAAEAWKSLEQAAIDIPGGTFELRLDDAQGLLNLNALVEGETWGEETLQALGEAAGLPEPVVARILSSLENSGPLRRIEDLMQRAGLSPAEVAKLGALATALPGDAEVNINAAPVELISLLIGSPVQARMLVSKRDDAGFLTPEDIETAQVILPSGVGYRSNLYRLRTTARIGATLQSFESLLMRRRGADGPEVVVIERRNAAAGVAPPPAS